MHSYKVVLCALYSDGTSLHSIDQKFMATNRLKLTALIRHKGYENNCVMPVKKISKDMFLISTLISSEDTTSTNKVVKFDTTSVSEDKVFIQFQTILFFRAESCNLKYLAYCIKFISSKYSLFYYFASAKILNKPLCSGRGSGSSSSNSF